MRRISPVPRPDAGGRRGFTLAEVLLALAAALVVTVAAASALIAVLRTEQAQFALLRDSFRARDWMAAASAGTDAPPPTGRTPHERGGEWEWAIYQPQPGRVSVQAITRVPADNAPLR